MAAQNGERSPILQRKKRSEGSAQGQEDGAGPSGEAGGRGQPREPEPGMSFLNEPMANGPKISLIKDLDNVATRIHSDINLTDVSAIFTSACHALLDCLLEMLAAFTPEDLNDALMVILKSSTDSQVLAQKMALLCRIKSPPDTIEFRNLLIYNFKNFLIGYSRFSSLMGALADIATQILVSKEMVMEELEIDEVFLESFKMGVFVQKCVSSVAALVARVYDLTLLERSQREWDSISLQLSQLQVPVAVRLKCLKYRTGRHSEKDFEAIQTYLISEYGNVASWEERVSSTFNKTHKLVTSAATHRLNLTHQGENLILPLLKQLDDIFMLPAVGSLGVLGAVFAVCGIFFVAARFFDGPC